MEEIKWGILGCGNIANKFAEALNGTRGARIQAVAARDAERAKAFAEKWNSARFYGDYLSLAHDPDIDIIYIATPHSYHFAHAKLCLESEKNVLCEKPFTINKTQLEILIKIAKERKLFLMEALWTRFLPGIIKAKEIIESGRLGEIITLEADFGINFPYDPEHRIYNPFLAGGALLDIGIYPLFLSMFLFGKPEMVKAHSVLNDKKIDLTTSLITKSRNGTVCHLNSTTQTNTAVKARIYGTKGSIIFNNWWFTPVDFSLKIGEKMEKVCPFTPIVNGYEYEAIEAQKCLQAGKMESDKLPLSFSLMLMQQMDEIRQMTGITYPEAIESIDEPYGWDSSWDK